MPATQKQIDFIESLCIDCGFDTRAKRNDFVSRVCNREVKYLDGLAILEASMVIEELLGMRDDSDREEAYNKGYDPNDDYRK